MKSIKNGVVILFLSGMVSCGGQTEVAETEMVTDDEVVVDVWDGDYFYTTFSNTNYYEDWDLDNDGFLSEEEFLKSFNATWDTDNDGRISQIEWNAAVDAYGVDETDWTSWDTDGDGYVEMANFETEFSKLGWYDAWDLDNDNLITEQEYTTGIYSLWDVDDDNQLDNTEYVHYDTYYGL